MSSSPVLSLYPQGCKHHRCHDSGNQAVKVISVKTQYPSGKCRLRIICHLRVRSPLCDLPFPRPPICLSTPVSYLLLWVERSRIRTAPPVRCSAASRGSASTFRSGSGVPTASLGQGDTWSSTNVPTPVPPLPHPPLFHLGPHLFLFLCFCCSLQLLDGLPHRGQHALAQAAQPRHLLQSTYKRWR